MALRPIERAYQLINEPVNPNLKCPVELVDIVNFKESEAGEIVEYFASPAQDRAVSGIYSADADGSLTYVKIDLATTLPLTFTGLQTKLETILIEDILNSHDQTAMAVKKSSLIYQLDSKEIQNCLNLVLGASTQEVIKNTGEDLLDVIIALKQKVADYCSDYILLVAPDVMDEIEKYDKENVSHFNYKMNIMEEIAKYGIKKLVKVVGEVNYNGATTPVLANGTAILIGRFSDISTNGRPITLFRRKFSKPVAESVGCPEGASRLCEIVPTPIPVNLSGKQTLGYSIFAYESIIQVLTNYRACSWSTEIIA